jgi:hypothetical protein
MKRPPAKKQAPPSAPAGRQYSWSIYHIKGTSPDEETAIRKAIDQFEIDPALQKRLLAQRR